jgi:hypothetical protein
MDQVDGLVLSKGKLQTFQIVAVKEGDGKKGRSASNFKDAMRAATSNDLLLK